jgi:hypothetical protein
MWRFKILFAALGRCRGNGGHINADATLPIRLSDWTFGVGVWPFTKYWSSLEPSLGFAAITGRRALRTAVPLLLISGREEGPAHHLRPD